MIILSDINSKTSVCDSIKLTSKIWKYELGGRDLYDLYSSLHGSSKSCARKFCNTSEVCGLTGPKYLRGEHGRGNFASLFGTLNR